MDIFWDILQGWVRYDTGQKPKPAKTLPSTIISAQNAMKLFLSCIAVAASYANIGSAAAATIDEHERELKKRKGRKQSSTVCATGSGFDLLQITANASATVSGGTFDASGIEQILIDGPQGGHAIYLEQGADTVTICDADLIRGGFRSVYGSQGTYAIKAAGGTLNIRNARLIQGGVGKGDAAIGDSGLSVSGSSDTLVTVSGDTTILGGVNGAEYQNAGYANKAETAISVSDGGTLEVFQGSFGDELHLYSLFVEESEHVFVYGGNWRADWSVIDAKIYVFGHADLQVVNDVLTGTLCNGDPIHVNVTKVDGGSLVVVNDCSDYHGKEFSLDASFYDECAGPNVSRSVM